VSTRTRSRRGFTLIEVMIAVVILAIGLSSLFTSEAGAVRIAQRARTTTVATLLARCKMAEIEERIAKEGWPGEQIDGRDECCEDAEHEGFRCEWKVERISLPDPIGEEDDDKKGGSGSFKDRVKQTTSGGSDGKSKEAAGAAAAGAAAALAATGGAGGTGALGGTAGAAGDGGLSEILTAVGATSGSGGGGDPFAAMVMELTFPVMKPVIEDSVRKATVTVSWKEGSSEQQFDVVQFLVNELPMLPDENATEALQGTGGTGGTGGTAPGAAPGATPGGTTAPPTRRPPGSP
jgi:general secretion pathway protein I